MKKSSTKPKGATQYKETAFGILSHRKLIPLEAEGMAKGLVWVINHKNERPIITAQLLLDLHKTCFGFIFPEWAGTPRRVMVQVSDYIPPAPHKLREHLVLFEQNLQEQMSHLVGSEKEKQSSIIRIAAWMQHQIVWIHPFLDYNGRIARLATNLLFLEYGLPLVEIPAEKNGIIRCKYIQAMQEGDQGNLKPLEDLLWLSLRDSR